MRGFPRPETVESWEGDPPPPDSETLRNNETAEPNPDTYAEKPVSEERNGSETGETPLEVSSNGFRREEAERAFVPSSASLLDDEGEL